MALTLKGYWNAQSNTPLLINGVGTHGDVYAISTSGTRDLGLGSMSFIEGNSILYSSSNQWIQIFITYNVDLSDIF